MFLASIPTLYVALQQLYVVHQSARAQATMIVDEPQATEQLNCKRDVRPTVDKYPIRSPQDVHTAIAKIIRGHELVEIGTRNGDGMACFAKYARRATAIELDAHYCRKLRQRNAEEASFRVQCSSYQNATVDADYYTWWTQAPYLSNVPALLHLRKGQLAGKIRKNATALVQKQ